MTEVLTDLARSVVVVPAPGRAGNRAGAPSAALEDDGGFVAYRLRTAQQRGTMTVGGAPPTGSS